MPSGPEIATDLELVTRLVARAGLEARYAGNARAMRSDCGKAKTLPDQYRIRAQALQEVAKRHPESSELLTGVPLTDGGRRLRASARRDLAIWTRNLELAVRSSSCTWIPRISAR